MPIPKSEWIWHNGEFVKWDDAKVHVTAHALHYGSSVFEGLRAYSTRGGPAILAVDAHIRRLFGSCHIMRMDVPYSADEIHSAIVEIVRRNGLQSGYVMISSWRKFGPDTFAALSKVGGNYVSSQFMTMEARDLGFADAIALDVNGLVSEGSGENIFAVYRGVLYTPPVGASILLGVTRECILTLARDLGYEVREQSFPREMLYLAEEVFLTGTAVEISPVRSVDRIQVGSGTPGAVTKRLQDEFFGILSGQLPDRHNWLTFVR
jgi:branched-chain amino acid aminotransferase